MNRRSNRNWKGYILAPSLPLSPKVKGDGRPGSGAWAVESRTPWPRCRTTGFPCSLEQGADHEHVGTFGGIRPAAGGRPRRVAVEDDVLPIKARPCSWIIPESAAAFAPLVSVRQTINL